MDFTLCGRKFLALPEESGHCQRMLITKPYLILVIRLLIPITHVLEVLNLTLVSDNVYITIRSCLRIIFYVILRNVKTVGRSDPQNQS